MTFMAEVETSPSLSEGKTSGRTKGGGAGSPDVEARRLRGTEQMVRNGYIEVTFTNTTPQPFVPRRACHGDGDGDGDGLGGTSRRDHDLRKVSGEFTRMG